VDQFYLVGVMVTGIGILAAAGVGLALLVRTRRPARTEPDFGRALLFSILVAALGWLASLLLEPTPYFDLDTIGGGAVIIGVAALALTYSTSEG
jgi:hypothetical protein